MKARWGKYGKEKHRQESHKRENMKAPYFIENGIRCHKQEMNK